MKCSGDPNEKAAARETSRAAYNSCDVGVMHLICSRCQLFCTESQIMHRLRVDHRLSIAKP